MSHKIGRNDLCSCGSGKKYKKCCMAVEDFSTTNITTLDFKWHQVRQLEGAVIDQHLLPYVKKLPDDVIGCALEDCFPDDLPETLDKDLLFHSFFIPWFLFNWIPLDDFGVKEFDSEKTLAQNYAEIYKDRLNNQERLFIEAMNQSYYSFYSVLQVEREKSLQVRDILLGTTHTIKERLATHSLKRGDIVFSRILTLDDQSIFIGMAPFTIPTGYHSSLLDFKEWLMEENNNEPLNADVLREESDGVLLDCFFDITTEAFDRPLPTLMNTDGDLIQYSKSYFRLTLSPEEALNYLLPMALEKNPKEFLQEAKRDRSGRIKRIEIPWLKKGNKMHKSWDNTILGHIVIEQGKLTLEANSQKRIECGQKLLTRYLGDTISFEKTLIENLEQEMKFPTKFTLKEDKESRKLLELPEVQEQIKALSSQRWENWFDEPIPALANQTPREAAKTSQDRERLEALLLHYERNDLETGDDLFKPDVDYLRRSLHLAP